jgi:hypothetical protein
MLYYRYLICYSIRYPILLFNNYIQCDIQYKIIDDILYEIL